MSKYTTKSGQNLYDVALTLYGSVEGIFDLLISNPNISLEAVLPKGTELEYHKDFMLNKDMVDWFDTNSVTIKNGNHQIPDPDIKSTIQDWVNKTNSQGFTIDEEDIVETPSEAISSYYPSTTDTGEDGISLCEETPQESKWESQYLSKGDIQQHWIPEIKQRFGLDIEAVAEDSQMKYWTKWFTQGMIIVPLSIDEECGYYDSVSIPKIKIVQSGKTSQIKLQIPANRFVAIDWGDDTEVAFCHFQPDTITAIHTYEDDGEHMIIIYGDSEYTNLDLSEVNGICYALTNIIIHKHFVSPHPHATALNKLFTINGNE